MLARTAGLSIAFLMVLVGGVWLGQGLGYIHGSFMTGEPRWATIGSLVAGFGVALGIVIIRRPPK